MITICPFGPIPVAPSTGVTLTTVGTVASTVAAVVKLLLKLCTPLPARSVTPLLPTDTVTLALPGNAVAGVSVTVAPLTAYVAATRFPLANTPTVPIPTDAGLIGSLKVTVTALVTATPVAPFTGLTAVTVGRVVSGTALALVVNVLVKAATAWPARSVTPVSATVYGVDALSALAGVKLTTVVPQHTLTVPATGLPPLGVTVSVPGVTVVPLTGPLSCTWITALTGTPVAPSGGVTPTTVGALGCVFVPVVNVATVPVPSPPLSGCPTRSVIPPVRYTPYCVSACSSPAGVKVAVSPSLDSVTVPKSIYKKWKSGQPAALFVKTAGDSGSAVWARVDASASGPIH